MPRIRTVTLGAGAALLATTALGGVVLTGAYAASAASTSPATLAAAAPAATPAPAAPMPGHAAAAAATAGTGVGAGGLGKKACNRLPARLARVQKVQARLDGDASTKGSIAALQARIGAATAAGKQDVARVLTDELAIRKDIAGTLPDRVAKLQDEQAVCAQHG